MAITGGGCICLKKDEAYKVGDWVKYKDILSGCCIIQMIAPTKNEIDLYDLVHKKP
jgi:hypothetical protein